MCNQAGTGVHMVPFLFMEGYHMDPCCFRMSMEDETLLLKIVGPQNVGQLVAPQQALPL